MAVETIWECDAGLSIFHNPDTHTYYETITPRTIKTCRYCQRTIAWIREDGVYDWHHYGKLTITEWP